MTEQQILQVYWSEPLSLRDIAKNFGVSHMSVWRLVNASARPV
jgi:DNA-directed RNA polymerase specialized sigma subunit